jgi:hypothetical protein
LLEQEEAGTEAEAARGVTPVVGGREGGREGEREEGREGTG